MDFVLVWLEPGGERIDSYRLQPGETLLDAPAPEGFVRPRWDGRAWTEGATAEQIAQWQASQPPQPDHQPDPLERAAQLQGQLDNLYSALERGLEA